MTKIILDLKPGNDMVTFSFVLETRSMQVIHKATDAIMNQLGIKATDLQREPYFIDLTK